MTTVAAPPDLAALYAAHRHSLVRMAVLLVDDLASAEDVVQDAFVAFHRNAAQLHDPGAAVGYLRVCVVNGARSVIRHRQTARKYRHLELQPDEAAADIEALLADEHRTVLRALRQLSDRQREVLTLRYWSDLSEAQIAEALGISRGAVKSNASRGMRRLGEILGVAA
jgi:RNA polymerase sigma-70 factor (sigma-E family)